MTTPINLMVADIYSGDMVSDFAAAKAFGLVGVIHKATEGGTYTDPVHDSRRKKAQDAGLLWGSYHFARSTDVETQVNHFLDVAKPDANTLLALDFEKAAGLPSNTMSIDQARQFMQMVEDKTGHSCVIYSGDLLKESLGAAVDPFFASRRLWLAQYSATPTVQASWKKPWLWQYSGDGVGPGPKKVPGIPGASGALDCNSYDGTPQMLASEWAGVGVVGHIPLPQPPVAPLPAGVRGIPTNEAAIRLLQTVLNTLGANPRLDADGKAGPKTQKALEELAALLPQA